jgi:signal transduction histidine kinase
MSAQPNHPEPNTTTDAEPASMHDRAKRPPWVHGPLSKRLSPGFWGISAQSAVVSATVVLVAVIIVGVGMVAVLHHSLIKGVDDAAASRVRDIAAGLSSDSPAELDGGLLIDDQRIASVQIVDLDGTVNQRSASAPDTPLVPVSDVTTSLRSGMPVSSSSDGELRISSQLADSPGGRYAVLVAGASEAAESTVATVVVLLAVAAPFVIGVAAAASHRLVKRSLRSVDAIRARVAEISSAQLAERVPVPHQNDEISALAITMNQMLARIEAGHIAQRQFVGDASHELRSPLATIISVLEVRDAHVELRDDAELANSTLLPEAYRMQALLEDLLTLARADERALDLRSDEVRLDEIAMSEADRLRRETRLDVHTDITPTTLIGDQGAILRVVRNLVDNATRHAAGRVDIEVTRRVSAAILVVGDDGSGIPESERRRVFDRFVRLDSDRARSRGGTGLGLSIVADIVAAHGGTVVVAGPAGGGTRVVVTLPV